MFKTTVIAALAALTLGFAGPAAAQTAAQQHMGHVMTGWGDTPGGKGLLPTAIAEAEIAEKHAGFAVSKPDDLGSIQAHAKHVLHTLAPAEIDGGPGLGYGAIKGAEGAVKHIEFAAGSDGATDNITLHSEHVKTAAGNAAAHGRMALKAIERVLAADSAETAIAPAREMQAQVAAMLNGEDENGDGKVTWKEGGLMEAHKHMGFMYEGEGMALEN